MQSTSPLLLTVSGRRVQGIVSVNGVVEDEVGAT